MNYQQPPGNPPGGYGPPPPGYPPPKKGMSTFSGVLLALIVFFVVLPIGGVITCVVCVGVGKGVHDAQLQADGGLGATTAIATETASEAPARPKSIGMPAEPVDMSIDVSELLKDYKGNELRGDNWTWPSFG